MTSIGSGGGGDSLTYAVMAGEEDLDDQKVAEKDSATRELRAAQLSMLLSKGGLLSPSASVSATAHSLLRGGAGERGGLRGAVTGGWAPSGLGSSDGRGGVGASTQSVVGRRKEEGGREKYPSWFVHMLGHPDEVMIEFYLFR